MKPNKVLLWMDGGYSDASARFIRGYALAEALRKQGISQLLFAGPETDGAFLDCNLYRSELLDNTRKSSTADFWNCITQHKPDIVIAEMVNPARIKNQANQPKIPFLALLGDAFSESLFFAKLILLPGFIPYPDFEEMDLLPSHLDKTLHGNNYLLLPSVYHESAVESNPLSRQELCIAITGNQSPKDIMPAVESMKPLHPSNLFLLADISETTLWQIQQEYKGEILSGSKITVKKRIAAIERSRLIIAFPSLPVYEFLARGKAVLLLPRNDFEMSICERLKKEGAAAVCPVQQSNFLEELQKRSRELWENGSQLKTMGENARRLISKEGAGCVACEILKRYTSS